MSDDGMELGGEQYAEAEPLTKQEMEILKSMGASLSQAENKYALWLRGLGNQTPRQSIKFSATVCGEALKSLRFLIGVIVEGGHFITKQQMAAEIIDLGIKALHHKLKSDHIGRILKAIHAMHTLPPEMAEKVITAEMRADIKKFMENMAKDNPMPNLSDISADEPDMSGKETRQAAPAVAQDGSDAPQPPVAAPSDADGVQSEAGAFPADAKCQFCGKHMKPDDRAEHGGKWMHHDCVIDAWKVSQQRLNKDK